MADPRQGTVSVFNINLRAATVKLCFTGLLLTSILAAPTQAQTFSVIHSFSGGMDGANPEAGVTLDASGNLYGTTSLGGISNPEYCAPTCGTVFQLDHYGANWILRPLYAFHGTDGSSPNARVIFGPDGTLYGTAGLLYNLRPPSTTCRSSFCYWDETVLYSGCCISYEGDLAFDRQGNVYGTSEFGGTVNRCSGGLGCGFVYQMTPSNGGGWNENTLYIFRAGADGAHPTGGVILDQVGNLYGTTGGLFGGDGFGSVFELATTGSGWVENTLYTFPDQLGSQGSFPMAGLIFDAAGNLYGATTTGGVGGGGTAFELTPAGESWNYNLLYSFNGTGYLPGAHGSLVQDTAGNLYGTTYSDGVYGKGSVFKLTPSNGAWTYTSLHDFTGGADGANPDSALTIDANGNLYGTTFAGGTTGTHCANYLSYECGVVFEITP